jgi:excisionase family DNA binding protein
MELLHDAPPPAPSLTAPKITRHNLATHLSFSLRYVDELTHNGTIPFFKIGKSVRYDLAEVEAALRERFHVQAKTRRATRSRSADTSNPAA